VTAAHSGNQDRTRVSRWSVRHARANEDCAFARRVNATESVSNRAVYDAVVLGGAFLAQAADEADNGLPVHIRPSNCTCADIRPERRLAARAARRADFARWLRPLLIPLGILASSRSWQDG
jgi:hypothetical protein